MNRIVSSERIERVIFLIRGQKVMLDRDLAEMYGVSTKVLNQAVRRNPHRFPSDFMFQLSKEEAAVLRSQIVTLEKGRGQYSKYLPFAFTEQGVAMLSGVLHSPRAVAVNVAVMRTFVKLRDLMGTHRDLALKLASMEKNYDAQFKVVFDAIRELMEPPVGGKPRIGFRAQR